MMDTEETIKNKDLKLRSMKPIFVDKELPLFYPVSVFDFYENMEYFNVLSIGTINLLQEIDSKDDKNKQYIKDNVKNFDVLMDTKPLIGMLVNLIKVQFKLQMKEIKVKAENGHYFCIVIQDKYVIHRENYDKIREYFIEINDIKLPKEVEDKELAKWFNKARKAKSGNNDSPSIGEILDLLCLETGIDYDKLMYEYPIYRVNRLVERYGAIQEFKSNVQYLCAGAEKIELKSYLSHIELDKDEDLSVKFDDFAKQMGGVV